MLADGGLRRLPLFWFATLILSERFPERWMSYHQTIRKVPPKLLSNPI
jgi:hypothetical protein